jgi:hypothetical protein
MWINVSIGDSVNDLNMLRLHPSPGGHRVAQGWTDEPETSMLMVTSP